MQILKILQGIFANIDFKLKIFTPLFPCIGFLNSRGIEARYFFFSSVVKYNEGVVRTSAQEGVSLCVRENTQDLIVTNLPETLEIRGLSAISIKEKWWTHR